MNEPVSLTRMHYDILNYLFKAGHGVSIDEMVEKLGIDQVFVFSTAQYLQELGLAALMENEVSEIQLSPKIELIAPDELPDKTILKVLAGHGAPLHLQELSEKTGVEQKVIGKNLKTLLDKGWAVKEGACLSITEDGKKAVGIKGDDEKLFDLLREKKTLIVEEARSQFPFIENGAELLKKRGQFLTVKTRKRRSASVSENGRSLMASPASIRVKEEATSLTSELLQNGAWKNVTFKPYDIQNDVDFLHSGKIHPFQRLLNQVRSIFYGMGFTETASPHVESSFWNFDALFQPQDHPARDMQDTFYVKDPALSKLPAADLVEAIKATHENGGPCASKGWEYSWNAELAKKNVLRHPLHLGLGATTP